MVDDALITYCGLCCLDCPAHNQKIPQLARDLKEELQKIHYDKVAKALSIEPFAREFIHYPECDTVLDLLIQFHCKDGCRNGGGPPYCQIRTCCQEKDISGCWECDLFDRCKTLDCLASFHGDAHKKNLQFLKEKGKKEFLSGKRFWSTILEPDGSMD